MSISVTISFSLVALLLVHLSNAETIEVFWNMPDLASRKLVVCSGVLFYEYPSIGMQSLNTCQKVYVFKNDIV